MAFSLYIDGSCASTSCTYVEYSGGYLQWNDADGGSDYVGTIYRDNVSKEFTYSGPDDLYLTTSYNPGSGGGTGGDDTPMVVTFNYYVDGVLVDDTAFEQIEMDMGGPIDNIWPRTLECYHIRFDKINPIEDSNPGTSGSTQYNSLEFTYIDEQNFNVSGNSWPIAGALNHTKVLYAFSHTYFSENKCVIINGTGYEAGESFIKKPTFHSNTTKSIEVNLYYTTVIVSTKVYSYNADNNTYVDSDLWGYVSVRLDSRVPSSVAFVTTSGVVEYATPLTGTHAIYCKAIAKPGFVFSKWVYNSSINSIDNYENLTEKERRNAVLALPAVETLDGSLPNTEIKIDAYKSNEITAVFKGLKNEVKLYKGLDFSGADTYYIYGGDKQWKNGINSNIDIKMLQREGATLIGWVYYSISNNYPTFTRTQYNTIVAALLNKNDYASPIDIAEELVRHINTDPNKSAELIIPVIPDGSEITPVLLPNKTGYTDSQGNWLTDNKVLYPLWVLDEYNITYKSHGEETLIVDETAIDPDDGRTYELVPSVYDLPEKYTIADNNIFKKLTEKSIGTFPQYYSFDKWEPSEIKPFTKTGDQTITAYWILDTYKITLEKNNNYPKPKS